MNTAIRTSLLCDAIPALERVWPQKLGSSPAVEQNRPSRPVTGSFTIPPANGATGVPMGTYTVIGSNVTTTIQDGEPVVSFDIDCSRSHRLHYLASQVVQTRIIGHCGGRELVELTIAYWRRGR